MDKQKHLSLLLVIIALAGLLAISAQAQEATAIPTEEAMTEMTMATGYSVDDLAPLAMAYYDGEIIYFIHPEASDEAVTEVLTAMMGPEVFTVSGLAEIPVELLGNVYVFTNGIAGMGPLGFQPDVFDSVPGEETYTPLRAVHLITWETGSEPRELLSTADIQAAADAGELVIETPGVVVNMPVLVWGENTR
ncbi:MAG: hypothetical protein H7X77_08210 [Anaerolineae bacterium]|nr:hypothetical protein [Anaerolineae bacterium]